MGQFLKGSKIGTCENMYYMRLEEAKKLSMFGKKDDDGIKFKDYLSDNATRFRFAFPDEDGLDHVELVGKNHDKTFNLPAGILDDLSHDEICISNQVRGGFDNVNIFLPCPHSRAFKNTGIRTSNGGAGEQKIGVVFQAIREGKEKTVFQCARCGAMFILGDEEVEKLKKYALEYFAPYDRTGKNESYGGNQGLYDYAVEILNRIK